MANVCSNEMRCYSDSRDTLDIIEAFINKRFRDALIEHESADSMAVYFDSRWVFPEDDFDELARKLREMGDNSLMITILSTEWGCLYAQFHYWSPKAEGFLCD